jgi:hypothetical protein
MTKSYDLPQPSPEGLILAGLLRIPDLARLYETNNLFHQGLDTLVAWLPGWVRAMANDAIDAQRVIDERIEVMKRCAVPAGPALGELMRNLDESMAAAMEARDRHVATVQERAAAGEPDAVRRMAIHDQLGLGRHRFVVDDDGAPCCEWPEDDDVHIAGPSPAGTPETDTCS